MILSKEHNSTKGDNPDLKNTGQLFFDKDSLYMSMKFQNPNLIFVWAGGGFDACTN